MPSRWTGTPSGSLSRKSPRQPSPKVLLPAHRLHTRLSRPKNPISRREPRPRRRLCRRSQNQPTKRSNAPSSERMAGSSGRTRGVGCTSQKTPEPRKCAPWGSTFGPRNLSRSQWCLSPLSAHRRHSRSRPQPRKPTPRLPLPKSRRTRRTPRPRMTSRTYSA